MADIRIKDLPLATGGTAPVGTDAVAIDGLTTRRTTITALGNVAVPIASQATAESGVNATERMVPLTVKQSIASEVGVTLASAAEGDLASTALQPGDIGTTVQAYDANLDTIAGVTSGVTGRDILADSTVDDVYTSLATAVWTSGTTRTMKQRATDVYCILDAPGSPDPTGVNDSTAAFEAMLSDPSAVRCVATAGTYLLTRKLILPDGVTLEGQGRGYEFGHKTKLLFAGTGTKEHAIAGATSTTIANPDAGAAYLADSGTRGDNYSTLDLTANFSAAIILGKASGLRGLGIYPNFNGVSGYAGNTGGLSDDWDVGVWARNSDWWNIEDCNVIGHWRKAALLVSTHDIGDGKIPSNEIGNASRCHFQGFRGVSIRSPQTVVGSNYGFAGTDFINCLIKSLWHQSGYLATSSAISVPFNSPSGCLELSGDIMRGIQFLNSTFIGRDDIMMMTDLCSEIFFDGCYEEGKSCFVSGVFLTNGNGARMVATSNSVGLKFNSNSQYVVDFSPGQSRDASLSGQRYTNPGVFNPNTHFDSDYSDRVFGSYVGYRMRKSTDRYIFESETGASNVIIDASGHVQSSLQSSGTVTVADDAAVSIPTPKKGGFCVITCCGTTENGNFPDPLRSGMLFYDVGTGAFSATKQSGGANFVCVNTTVTGTTGTDGNVTIGVIADNLRLENRQGASQVFRYAFIA